MSYRPAVMSQADLFAEIDSAIAEFNAWRSENGFDKSTNSSIDNSTVEVQVQHTLRPSAGGFAIRGAFTAPSG